MTMPSHLLLALSALLLLLVHPISAQFPGLNVPQGPNANAIEAAEEAVAGTPAGETPAAGEIFGDVDKMVFFTLKFGFSGGDDRLPEKDEVEELLCATQEFLLQHIGDHIEKEDLSPSSRIKAVPTNVEYKHEAGGFEPKDDGAPLTVEISFTIHATFMTGNNAMVPSRIIRKALELNDSEVLDYIYYAWDNTGGESLVQDVIRVHYTAVDKYPHDLDRTIMIPEIATCTDEQTIWTPNPGDEETPPPTMGETVDPEDVDDMVYFKFGVSYPEEAEGDDAVPSEEEVHQLMCALNRFIQLELAESTGDDSITAEASNIQWISSATNDEAGITLYFTADATDGQGEPVPIETVSAALEDVDEDELLQFLKTEGVEHFLEEDDINPMLELPTDVGLEPLPEGTPVREGNMEVSECPSVPPAGAGANRGTGFDLLGGGGDDDGNDDGADDDGNGDGNGDDGNGPAVSPTEDGSGGDGNGDGDATPMTIKVDFVVSNMEGITDPIEVREEGLDSTWPTLVDGVVNGLKPASPQLRGRRKLSQNLGLVEYRTNSASITSVHPAPCGDNAPSDLTCHTVHAKYELLLPKEMDTSTRRYLQEQDSGDVSVPPRSSGDPEIRRLYEVDTYKAIYDGTYYDILLEEKPDSPVFIGTLPKRAIEEPEDHYDWLWLVILLACLLALALCCLLWWCLYYYCCRKEEEREEPAPRPITQHTHVWVKNEDTTHFDDEASQTSRGMLNFDEPDPYALALVPVEEEGQLIPYEDKPHTTDPLRQDSKRSLVSID